MLKYSYLFMIIMCLLNSKIDYVNHKTDSLFHIAHAVEEEQLHIYAWDITYRDYVHTKQLPKLIHFFEKNPTTLIEKSDLMTTYLFNYKNPKTTNEATYKLIVPHDSKRAQFIVYLSGTEWYDHKSIADFIYEREQEVSQYLTKSTTVFTCVSAIESGIMENGNSMDKIKNKFNIVHKFTQNDDALSPINVQQYYGYNDLWDEHITIDKEKINVQMVLKQNEKQENLVTIGTPIILNEY